MKPLPERPLVQYWHERPVPPSVAVLIESFASRNPDLPHMVADEAAAEALIAERFGARELAAFRACAIPAMQADYFRYCALYALGGVYADADLRCVAPLRPLLAARAPTLFGRPELPRQWRSEEYLWGDRVGPYRVIANAFFAFPEPGHPLLELAIAVATANVERRVAENVGLVTGPAVFTSLYLLRQLGSTSAYVDYTRGGVLEEAAETFCEVVGGWDRVAKAFEGVGVPPFGETSDWVTHAEHPLPYKETEMHWVNVTRSIYR